jgi:HK97 family phage portal protein
MVGDLDRSSFSNIEQQSMEFLKYTLDPWVVRWEQSLQQALLLPSEKSSICIRFNVDGLLRGDFQTRMAGYSTGIQNGFLSVNDVRALEDLNLLSDEEGGNLHFVNGNAVKLRDVGAAYGKNIQEADT